MREILFRGKCDGEWKEGSLHVEWGETRQDGSRDLDYRILGRRGECYYVDPETVGQYTGLTDKNGKKIFEGDVVLLVDKNCDYSWYAVVAFGNPYAQYCWGWNLAYIGEHPGCNTDILLWVEMEEAGAECEIIGNIHDNPELLKEGGE